jgi:hypothetical protein
MFLNDFMGVGGTIGNEMLAYPWYDDVMTYDIQPSAFWPE